MKAWRGVSGLTALLGISFALLSACATTSGGPAGEPLTLADAGPAPRDALAAAKTALRDVLKDPESARVELIRPARPIVLARSMFSEGGAGWEICVSVNAKNSFGAYVGYKPYFILWHATGVKEIKGQDLGFGYCAERNSHRLQVGKPVAE